MSKAIFYLIVLINWPSMSGAQSTVKDISFSSYYHEIITHFPETVTGGHYIIPHRNMEGSPFYNNNDLENGTLIISGFEFQDIPLQYELWDDLLITITPIHRQKIILNPLKVDQFTLSNGSTFVKKENVPSYYYHKHGFYRQIIKDKVGLYCKHWKEFQKKTSVAFRTDDRYNDRQRHFLEIDDQLFSVNKRKDAFELLGLQKKEVRVKTKNEGIKYKKNQERYLEIMVEMANQKNNE